ncbi:cytochrome d ubiquinol oxidase subunit II [Klebsiella variicola subsp. variicola]|nr:cytochrome d ubiquinol oxidase subunit II [Klebsiella variicola subsp. variicola]
MAPVWDGNETWLVLGGARPAGAFPLAYAVITDALVIPLTAMLIGLIFRGVAFEFRFKAVPRIVPSGTMPRRRLAAVTFSQGLSSARLSTACGGLDRRFAGSTLDRLTPLTCSAVWGWWWPICRLGTTWLIMQAKARCSSGCAS